MNGVTQLKIRLFLGGLVSEDGSYLFLILAPCTIVILMQCIELISIWQIKCRESAVCFPEATQ